MVGRARLGLRPTVTAVRAGKHDCYDRVVLDIAGRVPLTVASFGQRYPNKPVGIWLDIWGSGPADPKAKAPLPVSLPGFSSIVAVVPQPIGADTQTQQVLIQTRARLPYRVFTLEGPGTGARLVIDVAHSW